MAETEWFDTTALCDAFGIDGACSMLVDATPIHTNLTGKYFGGGMKGLKHSEETKKKMSDIARGRDMSKAIAASVAVNKGKPAHNKGVTYGHRCKEGKLIKDGVVYKVKGIEKFSKEHDLTASQVGAVLNGKRKSHKGFRLYAEG